MFSILLQTENIGDNNIFKIGENLLDLSWKNLSINLLKLALLLTVLLILDVVLRRLLHWMITPIVQRTKLKWDNVFLEKKVFKSLLHLIPLGLAFSAVKYLFADPSWVNFSGTIFELFGIAIFIQLFFRLVDAFTEISLDENNYATIGIRTFGQLLKVMTIFLAVIACTAVLFDVEISKILTGLGAVTAIILLIFRDAILGFVSGVQIATTKMIKVGDWVQVPKYKADGLVKEINLTTAKIENFDKTISSIPTYDLISTEVLNYMPMIISNTRRIKKSVYYNIDSFKFVNEAFLEKMNEIVLLQDYINTKKVEIKKANAALGEHANLINGRQLTNIGLFRTYVELYLKKNPKISQKDTLLVRQMEVTIHGMPLEIYCFTNSSDWATYERIKSDIFDHILTASKQFDLEVTQTIFHETPNK